VRRIEARSQVAFLLLNTTSTRKLKLRLVIFFMDLQTVSEKVIFRSSSVLELFKENKFLHVAAPMVRYSKLPFRLLCRRWGCDLAYTPMIVSDDFIASPYARKSEFSTNKWDRPLIVQFAAKSASTLAQASEYVVNYCDGIDINCGCPQKWVMKEGYGGALLEQPELLQEMIRWTKERSGLPVSIKIRIDKDLRKTIELVQRAEKVGVAWVTVHGRRVTERASVPVNYEAVKLVKEHLSVPVLGNGHCFELNDVNTWREKTNVNGVMAARGLLQNPALFLGYKKTPFDCVTDWLNIATSMGSPFHNIHQHLMFMLFKVHSKFGTLLIRKVCLTT